MWSKYDLINRVIDKEGTVEDGGDWTFVSYPALDENDISTCEAMMPTSRLHKIREECAKAGEEYIWETMYMNNVVQKFGSLFPRSSLTFLDESLFPTVFDAVIGWCDPADRGSNHTCSVIIGISNGLAYVLDVVFIKKGYEFYKDLLVDQIVKWLPSMYIIESNKDGRIISVEIRSEVEKKLDKIKQEYNNSGKVFDVRIIPRNESKNKELRISLNSSTIKSMFVFKTRNFLDIPYTNFIKDLTEYLAEGNNDTDDAPDVLAGLASLVRPRGNTNVEIYSGK